MGGLSALAHMALAFSPEQRGGKEKKIPCCDGNPGKPSLKQGTCRLSYKWLRLPKEGECRREI